MNGMNRFSTACHVWTFLLLLLPAGRMAAGGSLVVKAANPLPLQRLSETLELTANDLAALGETNLQKIHIRDASGAEVLCQAIDTDFDPCRRPDRVIFQADFPPSETKRFKVVAGAKQVYRLTQYRAHGRFVRERFDDFAWENDRIAHRMYGKGLETWAGEPLTSSTVDIWSKRVPQMVIDEWYLVDNYHADTGQGADFYSAGASRGCGGTGLWAADKLWVSKNFVASRVLADGPIRVMFELDYEPFEVNGLTVGETKRISLDAGGNLDRFESTYRIKSGSGELVCGVGLKKVAGERKESNLGAGFMVTWQKVDKNQGMQGLAIVADPKTLDRETEDKPNHLLLLKVGSKQSVTYWAGFGWDKSGQFADEAAWRAYVEHFAQGTAAPIVVTVSPE